MYKVFSKKNSVDSRKNIESMDLIRGISADLKVLFIECGGYSYEKGLYRIHTPKTSIHWGTIINKYFPQYSGKLIPFAFDWMGREFAIEANENKHILMFDPSTVESFKIEEGLDQFHNSTLVNERKEVLSEQLFSKATKLLNKPNINYDQCIGYKTPLFLGGADSLENYEITDLEVYWEFQCQIYLQIKDLPPGTKIDSIKYWK